MSILIPTITESAGPAVTEASLAGITPVAAGPAGPGPGNDSATEVEDPNRGGLPEPPQQPSWPTIMTPDDRRRARLKAQKKFDGAMAYLGGAGADAVQESAGFYTLHYDLPGVSAIVRNVPAEALEESGPPGSEAEEWIMANKKDFKRRYGAHWRSYLYGKAWKLFGDKVKKECAEVHLELWLQEDGSVAFSASGDSEAARFGVLKEIAGSVAAEKGLTVLGEDGTLSAYLGEAKEHAKDGKKEPKAKSAWKQRRSLTDEEKAKLRVPHHEIGASVSFVPGKGYVVHTHRARSDFYRTPGSIPANSIKFISSTS